MVLYSGNSWVFSEIHKHFVTYKYNKKTYKYIQIDGYVHILKTNKKRNKLKYHKCVLTYQQNRNKTTITKKNTK